MVAEEPPALVEFSAALQGPDSVRRATDRLDVATARGALTVLAPDAAAERFPGLPLKEAPASPHLVGYRIVVRDRDDVRVRFDAYGLCYRPSAGALQSAPGIAYTATPRAAVA